MLNSFKKSRKLTNGFSLTEVAVALGILTIISAILMSMLTTSVRYTYNTVSSTVTEQQLRDNINAFTRTLQGARALGACLTDPSATDAFRQGQGIDVRYYNQDVEDCFIVGARPFALAYDFELSSPNITTGFPDPGDSSPQRSKRQADTSGFCFYAYTNPNANTFQDAPHQVCINITPRLSNGTPVTDRVDNTLYDVVRTDYAPASSATYTTPGWEEAGTETLIGTASSSEASPVFFNYFDRTGAAIPMDVNGLLDIEAIQNVARIQLSASFVTKGAQSHAENTVTISIFTTLDQQLAQLRDDSNV